jgi:hypothetical protein
MLGLLPGKLLHMHKGTQYHLYLAYFYYMKVADIFPEDEILWHRCQITVNAASNNQSSMNAIANVLFSPR